MKLVKHIANLGYGSRRQVQWLFREGRVTDAAGEVLYADDKVAHEAIRIDGEPLDPAPGMLLALHKPAGVTCSTKDAGRLVHDLLPPRFRLRDPVLSTVGRLDRDTSGLLLLTDDGNLLHRIISPKSTRLRLSSSSERVSSPQTRRPLIGLTGPRSPMPYCTVLICWSYQCCQKVDRIPPWCVPSR
jgi:16S rRNA U516 pseudouridylate synthase RsuA-like enzyme